MGTVHLIFTISTILFGGKAVLPWSIKYDDDDSEIKFMCCNLNNDIDNHY